ncbi:MAG TPA: hypothetical protein VHS99_02940, partial [Chloroflexota bacterium]|nr:hypothetical protein [Chloroflexota bacterium]
MSQARPVGQLLFVFLLGLYLVTGGGKGYSVDGAFGYEMAKTVFLDPQHEYFKRFRTAFARWGALMPLLGQPFVLAGDAIARVAPERDEVVVDGHRYRLEEWPSLGQRGSQSVTQPLPQVPLPHVRELGIISFLSDALAVPQGTVVGEVRLWERETLVVLPIRAGVETAEWALDRPDVAGQARHRRPHVAGYWIGQPRGNLYYARLTLPRPMAIDRWELAAGEAATWQVRAVAMQVDGGAAGGGASSRWVDVHTGERFWSARQTRDFFTRLIYSSLNAFTTAATAVLVYALAVRLGYGTTTSAVAALGYGVGTMAWPYAKLDFSEPASTAFVLLALWAYYRAFGPSVPGAESRVPSQVSADSGP